MIRIPSIEEFLPFQKRKWALALGDPRGYPGFPTQRAGSSCEVVGIQSWQESSQRIAAVASGRLGIPLALVTPREETSEVQLITDTRSCLHFGSTDQTVWERIATLSLALGLALIGMNWRVRPVGFGDMGVSRWPVCAKLADWIVWRERFLSLDPSQTRPLNPTSFPRQHLSQPTIVIASDASGESGPLAQVLPQVKRPLGLVRVFDPWESSPPRRNQFTFWGPTTLGRERWSQPSFRSILEQTWQERQARWNALQGTRLAKLDHSTEQPWKAALDPWFPQQGGRAP